MPDNQTILQLRSLTLNHEPTLLPDVKEIIINTLLGNPDGIRYRLLDSERKLAEIPYLNFFTLRKDEELNFVLALCERICYFREKPFNTYYVRYVTFNPKLSRKSVAGENLSKTQRLGNSFIKEGMKKHAESFPFPVRNEDVEPEKRLYYAYIEETNKRSKDLTTFFMEQIRSFSIITYSNLFPKKKENVEKVSAQNIDAVIAKIKESYKNHTFFFIDENDIRSNYFVLKKGDKIVAGLKAEIANWKIEQVPGLFGKLLKNVLPYLPVFSRLINRKKFSFLTFDTIFCDEGYDEYLPELFKSVCAELKTYSALIYSDWGEPLTNRLNGLKGMGFMNKMYKTVKGAIMANFINYSEEEKDSFRKSPVYVSGYDLT